MALGRVLLGEGINSNVGNCCVKLLSDLFSCLRENLESMCLPHSQWSTKLARSDRQYTVVLGGSKQLPGQGTYFYLICIILYNYPFKNDLICINLSKI